MTKKNEQDQPIKNDSTPQPSPTTNKQTATIQSSTAEWYTLSVSESLQRTQTDETQGLAEAEILKRRQRDGWNRLPAIKGRGSLQMIVDQFKDFMVIVLMVSAMISGFLGEVQDTLTIIIIVLMNATLGFIQEYRAEKAMESLKALNPTETRVLRKGHLQTISADELVVGDIVQLEAGDLIPADIRLLHGHQVRCDESTLTGESLAVEKSTAALKEHELPIGDRFNILHKGTHLTYGRGKGLVIGTGTHTELGKIATLLDKASSLQTPLQKKLTLFGRRIALLVIGMSLVIFLMGLLRGEDPLLMFMTSISLAVAAIPEALPAVITVLLALGARRMAQKKALIRRLPAVETLGSVTTICTDKTGTLTQNRMTVKKCLLPSSLNQNSSPLSSSDQQIAIADGMRQISSEHSPLLLRAMLLNNDAYYNERGHLQGDPTEKALFEYAERNGTLKNPQQDSWPRVGERPFSSERQMMSTLHQTKEGETYLFAKGSPEAILSRSSHQLKDEELIPLNASPLKSQVETMASDGLRVLAFAYKIINKNHSFSSKEAPSDSNLKLDLNSYSNLESDLIFIGFVGLMDPPREEVKAAVEECQKASIKVVMITGDHPITAKAIAQELGILPPNKEPSASLVTGTELSQMSDIAFEKIVNDVRVYARVSPEQKFKIVTTLQRKGEFVAMTGDGVNDAPALKQSNIGVAMGKIGTDVARESASMILLDDNFTTIVHAVREGRHIFDNIKKYIKYALATNSGEVWTLFLAPFFGLPVPFLPIHILWINLVTDGLPGLALAAEPEERGIMDRPPRHPEESILADGLWQHVLWTGLLMGLVVLGMVALFINNSHFHWQTMAFTTMTFIQMGHVLAVRSDRISLFKQGLLSNKLLLAAVLLTFFLQMATIYVPALNSIFKTVPLTFEELGICLLASPALFIAVEIEKKIKKHRSQQRVFSKGIK